ncbi:hypothetical protein ABT317_06685, partial [Streptomyces carpinensis]
GVEGRRCGCAKVGPDGGGRDARRLLDLPRGVQAAGFEDDGRAREVLSDRGVDRCGVVDVRATALAYRV